MTMMTTTSTRTNRKPTMIPAIQPSVHPPCGEVVPGDEVVRSLPVGDVVGGGGTVVAVRIISGTKEHAEVVVIFIYQHVLPAQAYKVALRTNLGILYSL